MEIFGWVMISLFALLGLAIVIILALPYIISLIKTLSYKITKATEARKIDVDARNAARKVRDEKLREKENILENKKLTLKLNKLQGKIDQTEKEIKLQEALKVAEKVEQEVEQPIVNEEAVEIPIKEEIPQDYPIIDEE